jgi:hypothetical protein
MRKGRCLQPGLRAHALDDDQERRGRALLLCKGAVRAHRSARRSLLSRTKSSSEAVMASDCSVLAQGSTRARAQSASRMAATGSPSAQLAGARRGGDAAAQPGMLSMITSSPGEWFSSILRLMILSVSCRRGDVLTLSKE